jgi:SAM-dependent methyltransferase
MSAIPADDRYSLGRTPEEHERLRVQARVWEAATSRLFDAIDLKPGARCLDAGCGPGETMRLMAERVGPKGLVVGLDMDGPLGAVAIEQLHANRHRQCRFHRYDLTADESLPGAPFDLVYARLLLFHIPERVAVLERLWDAVAPGGHLVIQEYDVRPLGVLPTLGSMDEAHRILLRAFEAAGADPCIGARLPQLFADAGIGEPHGTDVAGKLEPFGTGAAFIDRVLRSVMPAALAHGVVTENAAEATLAALALDAKRFPNRSMQWPLMVGAHKRKELS